MHPPSSPSRFPAAAAIGFCVTVWGSSFIAARHLLSPGSPDRAALDPVILAAARFAIASLVFAVPFAVALARREVSRRDLLRMALLGQIAFSTYFWLQYIGVSKTNAGIAAILVVGLFPAATAILSRLAGDRRPTSSAWAGLALGFFGVLLLVLEKPVEVSSRGDFLLGALCLVANAFAFAVYTLLSRRWMREIRPFVFTAGNMISGALVLFLFSAIASPSGWSALSRLDAGQWWALLFLSLVCSVGGFFAWSFALSRMEATRAAVWIYAEPVIAMALGATLLGERYGWTAFAGAAAIALSVLLVTRMGRSV